MSHLSEILPRFERFAADEEIRMNRIYSEIQEVERIMKKCPSLWGRLVFFDDIHAQLSVWEGKIMMERDSDKKLLVDYRVRDLLDGYHCLHKFLESLMQGHG